MSRVWVRADNGSMPPVDETPRPDRAAVDAIRDWIACGAEDFTMRGEDAGMPMQDASEDAGIACDPALAVDPVEAFVEASDVVSFHAIGGTGAARFALQGEDGEETEEGGGTVHETLGLYAAGETVGLTETVRVTDLGCRGEATARVHVVDPLAVEPTSVELLPMSVLELAVRGGSGDYALELVRTGSGGSVDASGMYSAGASAGRDVVRVVDRRTMAAVDATIEVRSGAGIRPTTSLLALPIGSRVILPIDGGSGHYDATPADATIARIDEDEIVGLAAGRTTMTVVDRYTGATTMLLVHVLAPTSGGTIERAGDALELFSLAQGDIDGDGKADVVLGHADSDHAGLDSGGVLVYRGTASGIEATPVRLIAGSFRGERLGASVALADLTGDGRLDLIAGAPRADGARTTAGAVHVFEGRDGAFFADEPLVTFNGGALGDELGGAIATCDFNADGVLDLALGATEAEDPTGSPVAGAQGAVMVFLGRGEGRFPMVPDQTIYGRMPEDDRLVARPSMRLGGVLAAGDFDGDAACDLAASMQSPWTPTRSNDGAAMIYRGVAATDSTRGGLQLAPARAIVGGESTVPTSTAGSRFAASMRAVDMDGDGKAELIAGHHLFDLPSLADAGVVRVIKPLASGDVVVLANAIGTHIDGTRANGQLGRDVDALDLDDDGRVDLVVGSPLGELSGGATDTGVVDLYYGTATGFTLRRSIAGAAGSDRLGQLTLAIPDLDGDGNAELAAYSFLSDANGLDVGALFSGASTATALTMLDLPGRPAGGALGRGLDVVGDVIGNDGFADLVVGGELYDQAPGRSSGRALVYRGTANGFNLTAPVVLAGFPGHAAADQLGASISRLGHFDRDGIDDFAVVARFGDRPATFAAASFAPDNGTNTCGAAVTNGGAVYVFRGVTSGTIDKPAFVYYLPAASASIEQVAGGFDLNGDGYGDLVVGTRLSDVGGTDTGSFAVIFGGRAPDASGKTVVLCAQDLLRDGSAANQHLGAAIAGIADVDGDGCDDLAVGARLFSPPGQTNAGAVDLVFGFRRATDPTSATVRCGTTPRVVRLSPNFAGATAGSSVASGDFDRDGRGDLLVGAPFQRVMGATVGRAYLVRGRYLASIAGATGVQPLLDPTEPQLVIDGAAAGDELGASVAFVPNLSDSGDAIAVGVPGDSSSGGRAAGSVRVHRVLLDGTARIEASPFALLTGESERRGSRFGETVRAARTSFGYSVAVGAPLASALEIDWGAAFVLAVRR